jgi:hypothetical protein
MLLTAAAGMGRMAGHRLLPVTARNRTATTGAQRTRRMGHRAVPGVMMALPAAGTGVTVRG